MRSFCIVEKIFAFLFLLSAGVALAAHREPDGKTTCMPGVVVAKLKPGIQFQTIWQLRRPSPAWRITPAFPFHAQSTMLSQIYYIHFDATIPPTEMASQLANWKAFKYVEPKYISFVAESIPDDSLLARQLHLAQIDMFRAWDIQRGDASTVIAIVDNGTDYRHPDLAANIWTNVIEAAGLPNVDDDRNGYVDDIHGWDFGENDNDPSHGTDPASITSHGTHIAGLASAVTNNLVGVAGVSWNCSIMPVKTSTDADTRQIPFGYEGIVYAADHGARVINASWGRRGLFSQFEQDVIDYAAAKGCLVVAAAGNSNLEGDFYPASYVHVIAVAAVNDLDEKASYSNYGQFIDISAPGGDSRGGRPGLFSTFPVERGSYGEFSGTSMASPVVAGVVALLTRKFPEFTPLQFARQVVMTSDPIGHLNPQYQGLIGYGRVNAFRALTEDVQEEEPAKVSLFNVAFNDSVWGNGNGLFERNEMIGVDVRYRNYAISPGRNLTIALVSQDEDILPVNRIVTVPHLPADTIALIDRRLNFRIRSQAKPHLAPLMLNFRLDNGDGGSDTVYAAIGKNAILLVDDDENGERNVEGFYTSVLDQAGVGYLVWNHAQLGSPSPQLLSFFPMVIWSCEWAFPSLDGSDRAAIAHYLDRGGSLFISGQDIGWDLADSAGEQHSSSTEQFYRDYLHAVYWADHSGSQHVVGVPGTIGQGLEFDIYQPQIPYHFQFPDWIEPAQDALPAFQYENGKGAGVIYQNHYAVLNLGFGFEAVDASQFEDPDRISKPRGELMRRILNRFGPVRHQPLSDLVTAPDSLQLSVALSPMVDDLQSLTLWWKTERMPAFASLPMIETLDHSYYQVLHLNGYAGQLQYYFLLDTPYYLFHLPVTGADRPFSIIIGRDSLPPQLYHLELKDIFIQHGPRTVMVFVQDNIAIDPNSVWVHYQTTSLEDSLPMVLESPNWFRAAIPSIHTLADTIYYWFSAADEAVPPNRATSVRYSYRIGVEGFEYGLTCWETGSSGWGLDEGQAHSGHYCMTTFPNKSYPTDADIRLHAKFGFPREQLKNMVLSFWTKHQLEDPGDLGMVEISLTNGRNWQSLGIPISGIADKWYRVFYSLSEFYQAGSDTLLLRFRLLSDGTQLQPMDGWFIDDLILQPDSVLSVNDLIVTPSSSFPLVKIVSIAPNPFNTCTKIQYQLSRAAEVEFEIFNLLGQLVWKQSLGWQTAGQHQLAWDGTTTVGKAIRGGIYFGRLAAKNNLSISRNWDMTIIKMLFLK